MKRKSLFLDDETLAALERIAKRRRMTFSEVVREAAAAYVAKAPVRSVPSIAGKYANGETDVASRVDDFLWKDPHG